MHISNREGTFLAAVFALLCAVLICWLLGWVEDVALGEEGPDEVAVVASAIRTLQPAASQERASRLAGVFVQAGRDVAIEPLILVSISRRESSFFPSVENLTKLGTSRQERGLMQNHGIALNFRPEGCPRTLEGAECQVGCGARYLAHAREECPGSPWRWVSYYGTGVCRSEAQSRRDWQAQLAHNYYVAAGGQEWE